MLEGRRFWFVGIGGAGLSGYAIVARAWGAEVVGWDRYETPYLEHVRAAGIPVTVSDEPQAGARDAIQGIEKIIEGDAVAFHALCGKPSAQLVDA